MLVEYFQEIFVFWFFEFEKVQFIEEVIEIVIERILFIMLNNKLLRLDGYISELFKVLWVVLWKDIVVVVKFFYCVKGFFFKGLNDFSFYIEEG